MLHVRSRRLAVVSAALLVAGVAVGNFVSADEKASKGADKVMTGQLVDSRCYVKMGATDGDHAECAVQCLKDGIPAALVTESGEMYYIVAPAMGFAEYANRTVRLTGKANEKLHAFVPVKIEVKKGDSWVEGKIPKSMM
jgi:hypothetical protein